MDIIYERAKDVHVRKYLIYENDGKLYYDKDYLYLADAKDLLARYLYSNLSIIISGVYCEVVSFSQTKLSVFYDDSFIELSLTDTPSGIPSIIFNDMNNCGNLYYRVEGSDALVVRDDGFGNLEVKSNG